MDWWRAVRTALGGMHAPMSVRAVVDWLVETQAVNRHWKLPRIRISYGRHSEKERAWDQRRREQLAQERGRGFRRRLVQLPRPERDGLAEEVGCSRRTVIRAMRWLLAHGLVMIHHENGTHFVPARIGGVEHEIGRGGCLRGGVGCAATWSPAVAGAPNPEAGPPEPGPPPEPVPMPRRPLSAFLGPDPRRTRGP